MSEPPVSKWEKWRAHNLRVLLAGGELKTVSKADGSIESWVELDGTRWDNNPPDSGDETLIGAVN